MKTQFKDVWYIEAGVAAIICLICGASGWVFGFDVWLLPVLLVSLAFYARSMWMFGHSHCFEFAPHAIMVAILMAILLPVFQKVALDKRIHAQKLALQKRATMRGHLQKAV